MEAVTAGTRTTGSIVIADLPARAAEQYADRVALRQKRGDEWVDVTYAEVGAVVDEIGLGLIALGVQPGDRVAILCDTRPEWTYADFAITSAGAVVVPIYASNSPEECAWVLGDSGSMAVICENGAQAAKIAAVRDRLPDLQHVLVIDPKGAGDDTVPLEWIRAGGRGRDPSALRARSEAVTSADPFTFIYTSGTTGPPKGCVLSHGNYRSVMNMIEGIGVVDSDDVTYLFLPLAHAFGLLVQLVSFDVGATIAYFGGDPAKIVPELQEVRPTVLPSVPRIFEKIYTVAAGLEPAQVRAVFGGRVRQAITGAAPIAPEILEFFYQAGVPVMEGYGMTETATSATYSTSENHKFGTVGRALPGVELRIADDGELLIKGANIFQGYYGNADATKDALRDGWLHTGDLASIDEDGYVSITGRKKDIIITAGGKNITPANFENDMKQTRWVSQCVMHGDRRPYLVALVTLDEEEIVGWAREQGIEFESPDELARHPEVRALIQAEVDRANSKYARVEQVKKFAILGRDLSQEAGELTPTLKVKRNVVAERHAEVLESLYA
jgi:long-chain acyl-CoA synthetase